MIVGDRLLIGSYDGNLYCLNAQRNSSWKFRTENYVHGTPRSRMGLPISPDAMRFFAGSESLTEGGFHAAAGGYTRYRRSSGRMAYFETSATGGRAQSHFATRGLALP